MSKVALGFTDKETIEVHEAHNLQELSEAIELLTKRAGREPYELYVENGDVEHVTLRLIENTLTDGSKTYDVRIS